MMARPKSRWGAGTLLLLLSLSYLCFFLIPILFSLIIFSITFVLAHAPFFALSLVFALVPTIVCRLFFVEKVPEKMLGVLVNRRDAFKALLTPGNYLVLPGRERIKELLSLEPSTMQVPVLRLKASDGEIPPPVIICVWRIHKDISQTLSGPSRQQIQGMLLAGQRKMEQTVRDHIEVVLRQLARQRTISELQADLADTIQHAFEQEVLQAANTMLRTIGLTVDQIEWLGAVTASKPAAAGKASKATENARALVAAALQKLNALLIPARPGSPSQSVIQGALASYQTLGQVRGDLQALAAALQTYASSMLDALDALARHSTQQPELQAAHQARKALVDQLTTLQKDVDTLGEALLQLDLRAKQLPASPFGLTPGEREVLLEVLQAIEQKTLTLEKLYP
jgi:Tfp pilus assembly protein PilO